MGESIDSYQLRRVKTLGITHNSVIFYLSFLFTLSFVDYLFRSSDVRYIPCHTNINEKEIVEPQEITT